MSQAVENCESFLTEFVHSKANERRKILNNCSKSELQVIVECVFNVKKLKLDKKQKACVKKCKVLTDYFVRRRTLKSAVVLRLFKKYNKLLSHLLSCVLSKLIEEALICALVTP